MADRYALFDGDRWWYFLGEVGTYFAGRRPETATPPEPMEPGEVRGWYSCHVAPDDVVIARETPSKRVVKGYRQTRVVEGYPPTMSREEYEQRSAGLYEDDDGEGGDPLVKLIYTPEYEEQPPARTEVAREPAWLVLDGAPPPRDGRVWVANLPGTLRERPEYLHLFPGHLAGFRDAVADALDGLDGVTAHKSSPGPLTVYVRVELPKLPPVPWIKKPDYSGFPRAEQRRVRARREASTEQITRAFTVPVPSVIEGSDRARACERWDELLAQIVTYIAGVRAQPCETCHGRGWVEPEPAAATTV